MFRKTMLSLVCTAALIGAAASTGSADDGINRNGAAAQGAVVQGGVVQGGVVQGAGVPGAPVAGAYCPPVQSPYYGAGGYGASYGTNFSQTWGAAAGPRDCNRFYHYPYVYYPQNFYGSEYYRSSDSMYYRYPAEMQIPVYNRGWHNEYPSQRRYHWGHQFLTDVF
jgi:hypothetical protein